jgi:LmbE family N-acetylglucosaminyl deacetylase
MERVLVFGAHPDDIEIGMGGTVAKYSTNKHDVLMVITSIPNNKKIRQNETEKAAKILGAKQIILDLHPNKIEFGRNLVHEFDHVVKDFAPSIVYTHWNHDSHQDHIAVANAVIASTRKNSCSLYMYEQTIPGGIVPYSFRSQMFVNITEENEKKIESIMAHKSQVKANSEMWLYGINGRAMYRGYQINVKFAETFEVVKEIKIIL